MANDQPRPRRKPGRVPTSCAECRRLKLRCDRGIPCEKCVSRGCGQICPDGVLATTKRGHRLVLANTTELHDEIDQLRRRIRELEDALRVLQETVSVTPHPLLTPELLKIKNGSINDRTRNDQVTNGDSSSSPASEAQPNLNNSTCSLNGEGGESADDADFIDTFGTLSIGAHGEFTFLGRSARSEYLLKALAPPDHHIEPQYPRISSKISKSGCSNQEMNKNIAVEVFTHLPLMSEGIYLAERYLEQGRHLYAPIPRQQLFDEIMTNIYRADSIEEFESPQALALLFAIFALGALFDPERPPYNVDSLEYLHLARTTYGLVSEQTTLIGIQALTHMCWYMDLSNAESNVSHPLWSFVGHNAQLAHSIGLHLDSTRWKLAPEVAHRRSLTFWSMFVFDTWTSFCFGRPPSLSLAFIDCPIPKDYQMTTGENGEKETGFHTWTFQYARFMHKVMEVAFGSKTPSYSAIIALDRQIRDFPVPPHLQPIGKDNECLNQTLYTQRWHVLSNKEYTLLHLHRGYFAQALQESPNDLSTHRYFPSVMATYRSAWRIGQAARCAWRNIPATMSRYGMCWSQALTAGLVMCIIATKAPNSQMGHSAVDELDLLAALFEAAAPTCKAAAHSIVAMQSLRNKGHEATGQSPPNGDLSDPLPPHELERLGGKTRLVSTLAQLSEDPNGVPAIISPSDEDNETQMPASLISPFDLPPMTLLPPQNMQPPIIQSFDSSFEALLSSRGAGGIAQQNPHQPQQSVPQQSQRTSPPNYYSSKFPTSNGASTSCPPYPDFSMFHDSSSMFSGPSGMDGTSPIPPPQSTGTPPGSATTNPAHLDETWHNFVEQLGF